MKFNGMCSMSKRPIIYRICIYPSSQWIWITMIMLIIKPNRWPFPWMPNNSPFYLLVSKIIPFFLSKSSLIFRLDLQAARDFLKTYSKSWSKFVIRVCLLLLWRWFFSFWNKNVIWIFIYLFLLLFCICLSFRLNNRMCNNVISLFYLFFLLPQSNEFFR